MSSTIIYHQLGFRLPWQTYGLEEDHFLVVGQMGASNCYEGWGSGRRSRSWQAVHFGTAQHVVLDRIRWGSDFEGRMVKMQHARGDITPEQAIRQVRRLISDAADLNDFSSSFTYRGFGPVTCSLKKTKIFGDEPGNLLHQICNQQRHHGGAMHYPYEFFAVNGPRC